MRKDETLLDEFKKYPRMLAYPGIIVASVGCLVLIGAILSQNKERLPISNAATPGPTTCTEMTMDYNWALFPMIGPYPELKQIPCPAPTPTPRISR